VSQLVLHPATARQFDAFVAQPSHAVTLVGATGSGKHAVASALVEAILQLQPGSFSSYAYGLSIASVDGKAIGIEAIRELEHFLSLKVPGKTGFNRAVIIENAHKLTMEAQNALLKTLEEPPAGTLVVLTASHAQALLPTIRSRSQTIAIKTPNLDSIQDYFVAKGHKSQVIARTYALSGGLMGLMTALLEAEDHPLKVATETARQLLGATTYERLLLVDRLSKQKDLAIDVLFILGQMAHVSLRSATGPAADKWQRIMESSYTTTELLSQNAQPKLALTNLMLTL
jgi:DNA polymerase-3 subunit delta'